MTQTRKKPKTISVNFYLINSAEQYQSKGKAAHEAKERARAERAGKLSEYEKNLEIEQNKNKKKETGAIIYMSIAHDGNRFMVSTGRKVDPDRWDAKKQRVVGVDSLNDLLFEMEKWAYRIWDRAMAERYSTGEYVDITYRKADFRSYFEMNHNALHEGNGNGGGNVFEAVDKFIMEYGQKKDLGGGSGGNWTSFKNTLLEYEEAAGKLKFSSFDRDFEGNYIDHWIKKGQSNSTINNKMRFLKIFLAWAYDEKYLTINDFTKWKTVLKTLDKDDNIIALSEDEVKRMNALNLSGKDKIIRDVFVFNCYLGQRFKDLQDLKKSDAKEKDGERWVTVRTRKTGKTVNVPLIKTTKDIIDAYEGLPGNKLLPVPNIGMFNDRLKGIARLAGITEPEPHMTRSGRHKTATKTMRQKCELMSSHVARKSFVTIAHNEYGWTIEQICWVTGHTSNAVMRYLKESYEKKRELMNRFENGGAPEAEI